ncbi:non-homologous end-joining DNA ligase [Streptomonospora salina]|uniref:Bifunctional non-homologous end joining protein LigD n=1 Tax=Streptomonospora salina TaxID=104205 RepID=A0A841E5K6_9ACTN|nr:non-homologous end-joining DNA ligase [Streptomonospora salina]MBB5996433.1 bifunctional non-homologous end joining protein LigD [Streptomonospora salina]
MTEQAPGWRVGGRRVRIHKPDKELFEPGGVTKRELAEYYRTVAGPMVRHLRGRPLAVQRYPHGIGDPQGGFYVKNRPSHAPAWAGAVGVPADGGARREMLVCDDAATLVWLADQAAVTLHPWLSRAPRVDTPDRLVIDLDPPGDDFAAVRRAAHDVREVLESLGLAAYPMTTGSRGVHVVAPIRPEIRAGQARDFARVIAELAARRRPDELTTALRKQRRGGRLFLDYLRNGYAQLAVAPYSVRALPSAPVATPMTWDELEHIDSARHWTVRTFAGRADTDPWRGIGRRARSPRRAIDRL